MDHRLLDMPLALGVHSTKAQPATWVAFKALGPYHIKDMPYRQEVAVLYNQEAAEPFPAMDYLHNLTLR